MLLIYASVCLFGTEWLRELLSTLTCLSTWSPDSILVLEDCRTLGEVKPWGLMAQPYFLSTMFCDPRHNVTNHLLLLHCHPLREGVHPSSFENKPFFPYVASCKEFGHSDKKVTTMPAEVPSLILRVLVSAEAAHHASAK